MEAILGFLLRQDIYHEYSYHDTSLSGVISSPEVRDTRLLYIFINALLVGAIKKISRVKGPYVNDLELASVSNPRS